ncbi:hypothetical protein GGQ85_000985 [Nitrobacter vulgaris]|uniref:DUF5681 domain-containing protein n=1 Tax=Nitrobacter vulgaris TaxID=29421 RepID=UPI00285F11AD|nr:DUF5681 domain-containing protein [Nitrobacter vulgaris]MDR6303302.1 hypothetical protein [Nitrobacter vulgaris]
MSKCGSNDRKRHTSPTKRISQKRACILRKAKNPEVGYCRPPVESQFKPGQSGNPKGRPKGRKSEAKMLDELLYRKVLVRGPQGPRKITVFEAILNGVAQDSIKGNTKAAAFLFGRHATVAEGGHDAPEVKADDQAFLDEYLRDYLAQHGDIYTKGNKKHEK